MKKEVSNELIYKTLLEHSNNFIEINKHFEDMDVKFNNKIEMLEQRMDAKFDMVINEIFELRHEVRILVKNLSEWRNS